MTHRSLSVIRTCIVHQPITMDWQKHLTDKLTILTSIMEFTSTYSILARYLSPISPLAWFYISSHSPFVHYHSYLPFFMTLVPLSSFRDFF